MDQLFIGKVVSPARPGRSAEKRSEARCPQRITALQRSRLDRHVMNIIQASGRRHCAAAAAPPDWLDSAM